jgi:hypothetical protein
MYGHVYAYNGLFVSGRPRRAQPGSANYGSNVLYAISMVQKSVKIGLSYRLMIRISEGIPKPDAAVRFQDEYLETGPYILLPIPTEVTWHLIIFNSFDAV